MKTVAYTCLHYGKATLAAAIRSVIDCVDEYWVIHSPVGSHGHSSTLTCPDHVVDLYEVARVAAGEKLRWYTGVHFASEGAQRDMIYQLAPDADFVLVLDADEVWQDGLAAAALEQASKMDAAYMRVPIIHFYRSWRQAILHDPAYPTRLIRPHADTEGEMTLDTSLRILHLGYAQDSRIIEYKQHVHGHKNEWRRDCDWFNEVYMNPARTTDLHPVGSEHWNAEPVNPDDLFPAWMREHPFYSMARIP